MGKLESIKEDCVFKLVNADGFDINFVIAVRDNLNNTDLIYDAFKKASEKVDQSICFTVVEHSDRPNHSKWCKKNSINYIYIPCDTGYEFDKELSFDMGSSCVISEYYIFHDTDTIMKDNFFENVLECIKKNETLVKCHHELGVVDCSFEITIGLLEGGIKIEDLDNNTFGVEYGGESDSNLSILVEGSLLKDVGIYDIYKKKIKHADNTAMELFKLWESDE